MTMRCPKMRRMRPRLTPLLVAIVACCLLTACAETSPPLVTHPICPRQYSDALVLTPPEARTPDSDPGWEGARCDHDLGLHRRRDTDQWGWYQIRTRHHQWTLNGRVREASRTTTRSVQEGRWPRK